MKPFITDIKTIQKRAREHILSGALTSAYEGGLELTLKILNEVLATEIVCVLRYRNHYYMAEGFLAKNVADEFWEHSLDEQTHVDMVAKRIKQLGGVPNFSPEGILTRSHSEYQEGKTLVKMIQEDLIAERIAIETYTEIIRYFSSHDPTSRRLLEEILTKEEEHADDLSGFLKVLDPTQEADEDEGWISDSQL